MRKGVTISIISASVLIILVVAFFLAVSAGYINNPFNTQSLNSTLNPQTFSLSLQNINQSLIPSGLSLNSSKTGGIYRDPTNNSIGFLGGYDELFYYQNPSGDQAKIISNSVYEYNSSNTSRAIFDGNVGILYDRGCVPVDSQYNYSSVGTSFGCYITNSSGGYSLYYTFFYLDNYFGLVSIKETSNVLQPNLENETGYYASVIASKILFDTPEIKLQ